MPLPFSVDLRWKVVWLYLSTNRTPANIEALMNVSERTVWWYISMFKPTDDVMPVERRNRPRMLMSEFEQLSLLRLILENPAIYLQELQDELFDIFGVLVSVSTFCRTLKYMECTKQALHRVVLEQSDALRAQFMAEISVYDPDMLIWIDETGCDRRHSSRRFGYSIRGIPVCDQRIIVRG